MQNTMQILKNTKKIIFTVLAFGLISCDGDESSTRPITFQEVPDIPVNGVVVQFSDNNFRFNEDADRIDFFGTFSVDTASELEKRSNGDEDFTIKNTVSCSRGFESYSIQKSYTNQFEWPIMDYLDPALFRTTQPISLRCSIDIEILNRVSSAQTNVDMKNVQVIKENSVPNLGLPFLVPDDDSHKILFEDIMDLPLADALEDSSLEQTTELFCDNFQVSRNGRSLTLSSLIADADIQANSPYETCRLIRIVDAQNRVFFSEVFTFWWSIEEPEIHIEVPQLSNIQSTYESLGQLRASITNTNHFPVRLQVGRLSQPFRFKPYFVQLGQSVVGTNGLFGSQVDWQWAESDNHILQLEPGETVYAQGRLPLNIICSHQLEDMSMRHERPLPQKTGLYPHRNWRHGRTVDPYSFAHVAYELQLDNNPFIELEDHNGNWSGVYHETLNGSEVDVQDTVSFWRTSQNLYGDPDDTQPLQYLRGLFTSKTQPPSNISTTVNSANCARM